MMADTQIVRDAGSAEHYYASAPFTGKVGKAAAEKLQRRAEEAAQDDKHK